MLPRRLLTLIAIPLVLVVGGTLGYYLLEPKYSLFDALYMTVITLTTVGYGEIPEPLSWQGRAFTMVLLLGGVFMLFYTATELIRTAITGELRQILGRRFMEQSLAGLRGHIIVCGYGRMGRFVCREFARQRLPYVVIDRNDDLMKDVRLPYGIWVSGDATSDEVLRTAGVERARALIAVLASDADNLYIVMSARLLNPQILIVARAEGEGAEVKLKRAGANRVVSPYAVGGFRMAHTVLRPNIVDFVELAMHRTDNLDLQIEELQLQPGCALAGQTLMSSQLRQELGVIVVVIKRADGHVLYNPSADAALQAGDTLIALGHRHQLDQLERMASGPA